MSNQFQRKNITAAGLTAVTVIGGALFVTAVSANEFITAFCTVDANVKWQFISPATNVADTSSTSAVEVFTTLPNIQQGIDGDTSFQSLLESVGRSRVDARREIEEFASLGEGWDGDNARGISIIAIDLAKKFLNSYDGLQVFSAFPDPDGSVGLQSEWQVGRILISFCDDETVAYMIRKHSTVHRGYGASSEDVERLLKSFA